MSRRWRDSRIGLDIDAPSELQLLKVFFNAQTGRNKVDVKRTGKGFHIRIFKKHTITQNFDARRALSDDPMRIEIDEKRLHHGMIEDIDTLFTAKRDKGRITREENVNVLALPSLSRIPARKGFKRFKSKV